ncbi:UDP-glucuronosyltransferase 2C1-like isoform X1 [Aphis craccivora]|uniref:UDP-glucuronosyltransferase n=1 Tax=Aphis craccivora TaxID=307492 RepID=A0A6G0YD15_APHCR|nr:UDP-glucuronosyltransferase 2C1-like isoform X1 [Aphis craccivora]
MVSSLSRRTRPQHINHCDGVRSDPIAVMSPNHCRRALDVLVLCSAAMALTAGRAATSPSPPHFRAANILAVETVPGRSHWNFMSAVLRALTDRGHSVVAFTSYPSQQSPTSGHGNYTEVDTSAVLHRHAGERASRVLSDYSRLSYIVPSVVRWSREFCDAVYDMEQVRALMVNGTDTAARFDLLVTEPLGSECVAHLAAAVGLPMVYVVPTPMITYMQPSIVGHSANPAYVPHLLYGSAVRAFRHRLANTAVYAYGRLNIQAETNYNEFLTFQNIQEFIENSPHGVIYFTFGSVVAMSSLPDHIQDTFKNVFRQIPQRVLWKFEGEMKDKPNNVMTGTWFPQRDVLLHPNVKLFISHGGISGVYEAVDAGVPVLGFPLYYDQPRNLQSLVDAGMAITMELLSITEQQFLHGIKELLHNKNYTKNALITAERFKDRPMTPQESVVYWTEYVLRHKGAHHLKSEALNLTWYQYMLLDVIFVFVVSFLAIMYLIYKMSKYFYSLITNYLISVKIKQQ